MHSLVVLNNKIIRCKKCPRLSSYIKKVGREKVKRFNNEKYWARPLPGFGDVKARLLIVGLAPAAHGGNRTGRMFTGDSSGQWLARVLYENNFATKPTSEKLSDGFNLIDSYVTAVVRCAPPQNKPLKKELDNCSGFIKTELDILKNVKVIICLGRIAFESCCKLLHIKGYKFGHGKIIRYKQCFIISSYHPSRQNTQTGRLTWNQWLAVFLKAKEILASYETGSSNSHIQ